MEWAYIAYSLLLATHSCCGVGHGNQGASWCWVQWGCPEYLLHCPWLGLAGGHCCLLRFEKIGKVVSNSFCLLFCAGIYVVMLLIQGEKEHFHNLQAEKLFVKVSSLGSIVLGAHLFCRMTYLSTLCFAQRRTGSRSCQHMWLALRIFFLPPR